MSAGSERLACFELWGGNRDADHLVELPGLAGWVYSAPFDPGSGGGDVHYISVCSRGLISRIVVADVAGHGSDASRIAQNLRSVLQRHTNNRDQSALMRELNQAFVPRAVRSQYATAAVFSFYVETAELVFSNAGHPPALWYRVKEDSWELLEDDTAFAVEIEGLPLGLIPGTSYSQTGVRLGVGDALVLYTDGITEAMDSSGAELGHTGLLKLARGLEVGAPADMARELIAGVRRFTGNTRPRDDETLVVLQHVV